MGRKETIAEQAERIRNEAAQKRAMIEEARELTQQLNLESGTPQTCIKTGASFRVVDEFLAVVDGRADLTAAMKFARNLLHDFEAVAIMRDRSVKDIAKSHRAMSSAFDKGTFGAGLDEGFLFPWAQKSKYVVYRPTLFSMRQYTRKPFGFLAQRAFGQDIDEFARATRTAFPEYLNTTIKRNSAQNQSSSPGWIHTDGPYNVEDRLKHFYLPNRFLKAMEAEDFEPLPGEATITMVLNNRTGHSQPEKLDPLGGAGTIVLNSKLGLSAWFFQDTKGAIGHQVRDGDVMVMRGEGWPDHPVTGEPRSAAHHFAALENMYGHSRHSGRMLALATSKVSYVHPRVRDLIEPEI